MDGVFVLDVSNSIGTDENFETIKNFVIRTLEVVNVSAECSHAAVILFADDAYIRFDLNNYTDFDSLVGAIRAIDYQQEKHAGTNTPQALDLMRIAGQDGRLGLRDGVAHISVVVTDGKPQLNNRGIKVREMKQRTIEAGDALRESRVYHQVYAVGIETSMSGRGLGDTLHYIADPTPDLVYPINGFDDALFMEIGLNITQQFCNRKCTTCLVFL